LAQTPLDRGDGAPAPRRDLFFFDHQALRDLLAHATYRHSTVRFDRLDNWSRCQAPYSRQGKSMSEKSGNKLDPSFWLALFFAAIIAVLVGTAARLDWDTRLFPWAIGIPALALAVRQLLPDWRSAGTNGEQGEATRYAGVLDIPVDRSIPPEEMFRHTVRTAYWILTFAIGIWFLGFLIAIPVFIFSYL